ncbi:MAG: AgmX/PglI C-terminal domain-containing protein [Myxococcales bacterium]|nr:AgmX/PglI C-terminal domain-containing protein [Myxococcales bacterium]
MVLALNLLMVGAGVALFLEYLNKRGRSAAGTNVHQTSGSGELGEADEGTKKLASPEAGPRPGSALGKGPGRRGSRAESIPERGANGSTNDESDGRDAVADDLPAQPPPAASEPPPALEPTPSIHQFDAGAASSPSSIGDVPDADTGITGATVQPQLSEEEEARQVRVLAGKIGLVVERHQSQLGRCYQGALKQINPKDEERLEGRVDLHFSVQPNGSAREIRVRSNSTGSKALARCLVALVGSWTFPSSGSEALDFVWPFEFQAPK